MKTNSITNQGEGVLQTAKRPLCWVTRHHWLLQFEVPISRYADNDKIYESEYWYQCQVCGKWNRQKVVNLDNQPKEDS